MLHPHKKLTTGAKFDCSYRLLHKVSALNNLYADLHEFRITPSNTVLITAYAPLEFDLSYHNLSSSNNTYIFDGVFQEIDIASQTLLFEWRASEHFRLEDCYNIPRGTAGSRADPFDYFHINSVDKDADGDYIVSARYSHAITKISGTTGQIIWHLGGKNNSFTDVTPVAAAVKSSGRSRVPVHNTSAAPNASPALDFAYQHHASWHPSAAAAATGTLSLFDNAAFYASPARPPRGILLSLSLAPANLTVSLLAEYKHPDMLLSESQGSMQVLANNHVLLGYGSAAAFTEFTPDGKMLCDAHFGALYFEQGRFTPGAVASYRVFKRPWHGWPAAEPRVKFRGGFMFVSWNGATEVREWVLQSRVGYASSFSQVPEWTEVSRTAWTGYESNLTVPEGGAIVDGRQDMRFNSHAVYRLVALANPGTVVVANSWWRWGAWSGRAAGPMQHSTDESKMVLGIWEVQTDDTLQRVSQVACAACSKFDWTSSRAKRGSTSNTSTHARLASVLVATMVIFMVALKRREFRCLAACILTGLRHAMSKGRLCLGRKSGNSVGGIDVGSAGLMKEHLFYK